MAARKSWMTNWVENAAAESWPRVGGQGKVRLVHRREDPARTLFVLKELKEQKAEERRSRMRREVVALDTLPHPATPRVIEHNTDSYRDPSVDLYAVFEFIDGPTLAEYVDRRGLLPMNDALAFVTGVLNVIEAYHLAGVGHRDIKPDNIVFRGGECTSPVLIDFGLTFNLHESQDEVTPDWQQVGNRFLALPEHAMFSADKRDLRSDVTFCVGLLYFVLTGIWPVNLLDEADRPPHQRPEVRKLLDALPEHPRYRVLHVFDVGFAQDVSQRWQTAAALRTQLELAAGEGPEEGATETQINRLRDRAAAIRGNRLVIEAVDHVRGQLDSAAREAARRLGEGYSASIESRPASISSMNAWIKCGVGRVYEGLTTNTPFLISAIGGEIVVEELFDNGRQTRARVPLANYQAIAEMHESIIGIIIANVSRDAR